MCIAVNILQTCSFDRCIQLYVTVRAAIHLSCFEECFGALYTACLTYDLSAGSPEAFGLCCGKIHHHHSCLQPYVAIETTVRQVASEALSSMLSAYSNMPCEAEEGFALNHSPISFAFTVQVNFYNKSVCDSKYLY